MHLKVQIPNLQNNSAQAFSQLFMHYVTFKQQIATFAPAKQNTDTISAGFHCKKSLFK